MIPYNQIEISAKRIQINILIKFVAYLLIFIAFFKNQ